MTIISASYRTDIPAFYADWFEQRLQAGYCDMANPYGGKPSRISLTSGDVTAFVFWTRNIKPFGDVLTTSIAGRFPFMVQFTVTGYPDDLEKSVIDSSAAVQQIRDLAHEYGPDICVWRYDPVLISNLTPTEFHLSNFARLAALLSGSVNEVVVSFTHYYAKTKRNLSQLTGFNWQDPELAQKQDLLGRFARIATLHGMTLSLCSQPEYLIEGCYPAACIDLPRLQKLGVKTVAIKQKGNRTGCACYQSRDIGAYDTCVHGCLYCYAVASPEKAKANFRQRDINSSFLRPIDRS